MIWSKLKKQVENLLADSLKGHIEYHLTRYGPGVNAFATRGWITLKGQEILNCSTDKYTNINLRISDSWFPADDMELELLNQQAVFSRQDFIASLEEYINLEIDEAIDSPNPLIRAFSMFDKRVGKRRIKEMTFTEHEYPFVKRFYTIRYEAEGMQIKKIV